MILLQTLYIRFLNITLFSLRYHLIEWTRGEDRGEDLFCACDFPSFKSILNQAV